MRVSEKSTENSERLGRQMRRRIKLGTYRLPIFSSEPPPPLVGPRTDSLTSMPYPGFGPGTFGLAAGSPNHYIAWSAHSGSEGVFYQGE